MRQPDEGAAVQRSPAGVAARAQPQRPISAKIAAPMILYGHMLSSASYRVRIALGLKGLQVTSVLLDLIPAWRRGDLRHPFGVSVGAFHLRH